MKKSFDTLILGILIIFLALSLFLGFLLTQINSNEIKYLKEEVISMESRMTRLEMRYTYIHEKAILEKNK